VKTYLIRAALGIMRRLPLRGRRAQAVARRLFLADLARRDSLRWRIEAGRDMGVRIGENCRLYSLNIFSEPYLVEIGDNVIVSGEVIFLTHDGAVNTALREIPDVVGHYGKIRIGDNCFIGMRAVILPNVQIGNNCIVAAGAVVVESFPDDSVIMGNPARLALTRSMYVEMKRDSPLTVKDAQYRFPGHPPRELVLEKIGDIPIKESRRLPPERKA